MVEPEVMLIFPPVVYSNFGRYYPSTAMLAAFLETNGVKAAQFDLNQVLLESVLSRKHLDRILAREEEVLVQLFNEGKDVTLDPALKELLAAKVLTERQDCFRDPQGKIYPAGHPRVPLEILGALSYPYYLDPPLSVLSSHTLWELPQAHALRTFFHEAGIVEQIPESVHTVGISVPMGPQLGSALILAKALRERRQVRIVLGGPAITLLNRYDIAALLLANDAVDAAVQYQGEVPLLNLAQHFARGGKEPWRIPGALAINDGELLGNSGITGLPKLSELPFGLYETSQLSRLAAPEISVRQAEGCYWGQCAYCDYVELYPKSAGRYRPQYVGRLVDEMKFHMEQHGVNRFCLITESLPPKVGKDLGRAILDLGLKVSWNSFAMVDPKFDIETLEIMAASGCTSLCIGVETVIDSVLSLVRKRATRDMTIRFFENCREAGIKLEINLIPNLPSTTRDAALEALEVIERNIDGFSGISVFPFEATRSSDIGRNPERFKLKVIQSTDNRSGQAEFCANHLQVKDPAMSEADLEYVVGRYRNLAARVSQKELNVSQPAHHNHENESEAVSLRFDERYVKIMLPEGEYQSAGPLLFNWMSGRMCHFPQLWNPIFRWLRKQEKIEQGELAEFLEELTGLQGVESEAIGIYVINRLKDEGVLVPDNTVSFVRVCAEHHAVVQPG